MFSFAHIEIELGIPKWKIRRWMRTGIFNKEVPSLPYQRNNIERPKSDTFSRRELIELYCVLDLINQGFRKSKIQLILDYIRSNQYDLQYNVYQTDGVSIWPRIVDFSLDEML